MTVMHEGQSTTDKRKILLQDVHVSAPHVPARAQIRYDSQEEESKRSRTVQIKASAGIQAVLCAQVRGLKKIQLIQNQRQCTSIFSTSHV